MLKKYLNEIASVLIGICLVLLLLFAFHVKKQEAEEPEKVRKQEIKKIVAIKTTEKKVVPCLKIEAIKEIEETPDKFSSYVVSVQINLNESTDTVKAIADIRKACGIIGTAPMVSKTEVIGVQGRVYREDKKEKLFDLDIEK